LDEIPVETGRRAVTENVPGIIALSKACELAADNLEEVNSNKVNTYYTVVAPSNLRQFPIPKTSQKQAQDFQEYCYPL